MPTKYNVWNIDWKQISVKYEKFSPECGQIPNSRTDFFFNIEYSIQYWINVI